MRAGGGRRAVCFGLWGAHRSAMRMAQLGSAPCVSVADPGRGAQGACVRVADPGWGLRGSIAALVRVSSGGSTGVAARVRVVAAVVRGGAVL